MDGLKIEQLRRAATRVVDVLDREDQLHLAPFDEQVTPPWQGLEPANESLRSTARSAIASLTADASTNIEQALDQGFTSLAPAPGGEEGDERMPVLVFLTDG